MITIDAARKMTVAELLAMLNPDLEEHDTFAHLQKVEEVLAEVVGRAGVFYAERDDYIGAYAFYLALSVAQADFGGLDETDRKRMIDDIGNLAYHMLGQDPTAQEWMSPTTLKRLQAIVAASGINDEPAASPTETMEASHA
jgi:hypothetical protein